MRIKLLLSILLSFYFCILSSQIKVRLFTEFTPDYAIFTVIGGQYRLICGSDSTIKAENGEMFIIARAHEKVIVRKRNGQNLIADSVEFRGTTGNDRFSLRVYESGLAKRNYTGDLKCFSDMSTLLLLNILEIEKYIEGVVSAESGTGKDEEFFRTQAVIARTYTYRYFDKHLLDSYNLCDDTHCQAYNGLTDDSLIMQAVKYTGGQVITTPDSVLIISAFHSNCGGETSPSEFAWVTGQTYLKRVSDPYCKSSRSATWETRISIEDWKAFLMKNGLKEFQGPPSVFNFIQTTRVPDYIFGSFSIPLRLIRSGFGLRSTYFSVTVDGDSLLLKGKGYGHGVGVCQEGAMAMALNGFTYQQIIEFYYSGVMIIRIDETRKIKDPK